MNWAKKEALRIVNAVGFTENAEAAIAAALQQVADECAEIVENASLKGALHAE